MGQSVPSWKGLWMQRRRQVRRQLGRWRGAVARSFFRFDAAALSKAISTAGVRPGDVVLAHVAYDQFVGFTGSPADVIRTLQQAVGGSGTLLMPTLPFQGMVIDYVARGQVTDLKRTPSAMGLVTEIFRRMPGVIRSVHPTHPVALWGARADELARDHHLTATPCGQGSPYLRLLDHQGKILFLGAAFTTMTFYHGVEEVLAPRLPFSPFTVETFELQTRDTQGRLWTTKTKLFDPAVSRRRNVNVLKPQLKRRGEWHASRAGMLSVVLVEAQAVFDLCVAMANRGEHCYGGRSS